MVLTPKNHIKQYPFVDRKYYIQTFIESVNNIGQKKFGVLVYYGVAGIGKTSLRKEFPKYLDEHYVEYPNKELVWASINLQFNKHREKNYFLVSLKNELQKKYKINFPAFEIAHAIYWKKANPEIPLMKENYLFFEGDNAFDDFFGIVNQIPYFSIVPATARLIKSSLNSLQKWWKTIGEAELLQLSEKEPLEIEEYLPDFWAQDLNNYLERTSKSAVLLIDTYEALWENYRSDGHSRDEWIREELIPRLPRKVLWVICGKEALKWEETDHEWSEYLTQCKVEELFREYCIEYLKNRGITDKEIQEAIFNGSKGVPYYLELSADTYERIIKNDEKPKPEELGDNYQNIADRFFRYLSPEEKNSLKVLSIPHFWDYDLFEYLTKECSIGYPTTNYEDLCSFSFVVEIESGRFQMHQLMQESLQKKQEKENPDSVKRIHEAIIKYYMNRLRNIDIKAITPEHEIALTEVFYHAKSVFEIEDLFSWFTTVLDPFYRAAFWQLITPMYEEMLRLLETKLEPDHIYIAIALNNLAKLYQQMTEYKKALPLYEQACKIFEETGKDKRGYSSTLNNLGSFYKNIGKYDEALLHYNQSLNISKIELGSQHPDVAITLSNLAELYGIMGDYENASSYYKQALEIFKKNIKTEDQNYAITIDYACALTAFAELCRQIGDYETSLTCHMEALKTRETVFGQKHPEVANSLHNFALLLLDMSEYERALDKFDHALRILENGYSAEYPTLASIHIASVLSNKAVLYGETGEYDKALLLYQRALNIRRDTLGSKHLDVANTLNNLANLYCRNRDYDKAIPLLEEALDIIESRLGTNHPYYVKIMDSLIYTYGKF